LVEGLNERQSVIYSPRGGVRISDQKNEVSVGGNEKEASNPLTGEREREREREREKERERERELNFLKSRKGEERTV